MVKRSSFIAISASAATVFLALGLAGCGIWGESAPRMANVRADLTGATCPEMGRILKGSDSESKEALECWSTQLRGIWNSVEGEKPDQLSEAEISVLVKQGIIAVKGDKKTFLHKVFLAKKLVGLGGPNHPLKKAELDALLDQLSARRGQIRALYRKFALHETRAHYEDFELAATVANELLGRLDIHMTSKEILETTLEFIDISDSDFRNLFLAASDTLVNIVDSICPMPKADIWDAPQIGACLTAFTQHFRPAAPWAEFLMNPTTEFTPGDVVSITNSLQRLADDQVVDKWFRQKGLKPLYPKRWEELARRMGANPPDLEKGLSFVKDLKGENENEVHHSTGSTLYPDEVYPFIFWDIVKPMQTHILEGLPWYMRALKNGECEGHPTYWTECVPTNLDDIAGKVSALNMIAMPVRNLHYGAALGVAPMDGEHFSRIMMYDAIAVVAMHTFHDHCNDNSDPTCSDLVISVRTDGVGENADNLVRLIDTGIQGGEAVSQFITNFTRKLNGLPLPPQTSFKPHWNPQQFARLVALSNDLLVKRTPEDMDAIGHLLANFYSNSQNTSVVYLDHWAVTALLTTVDILSDFRQAYLGLTTEKNLDLLSGSTILKLSHTMALQDRSTRQILVDRDEFMRNLPRLLQKTFPRTYQSCSEFGFDASCRATFDTIIPQPTDGSRYILASDLDVMTISAIAVEGLFDVCDRNNDSKLTVIFGDGNDELDCGFSRTKDVLERLMDSGILPVKNKEQLKMGLDFLNSFAIPRIWAKTAMVEGRSDNLFWRGLISLLLPPTYYGKSATLGSIYGLVGNIANPEQAKANRPNPTPTPYSPPQDVMNDSYHPG